MPEADEEVKEEEKEEEEEDACLFAQSHLFFFEMFAFRKWVEGSTEEGKGGRVEVGKVAVDARRKEERLRKQDKV